MAFQCSGTRVRDGDMQGNIPTIMFILPYAIRNRHNSTLVPPLAYLVIENGYAAIPMYSTSTNATNATWSCTKQESENKSRKKGLSAQWRLYMLAVFQSLEWAIYVYNA